MSLQLNDTTIRSLRRRAKKLRKRSEAIVRFISQNGSYRPGFIKVFREAAEKAAEREVTFYGSPWHTTPVEGTATIGAENEEDEIDPDQWATENQGENGAMVWAINLAINCAGEMLEVVEIKHQMAREDDDEEACGLLLSMIQNLENEMRIWPQLKSIIAVGGSQAEETINTYFNSEAFDLYRK